MHYHIIETIKQYEQFVESFKSEYWFRGHSLAKYRLEPNIYRDCHFRQNLLGYPERSGVNPQTGFYYIYQYKIADKVTKKKNLDYSFIERMYENQHYNILTPLLDFSTDPLVALFFAVENHSKWDEKYSIDFIKGEHGSDFPAIQEEAGAVFLMNPQKLNVQTLGTEKLLDSNSLNEEFVLNNDLPFAISPSVLRNPRITAQSGKFVCFGLHMEPLDFYEVLECDMVKILIPNSSKKKIFEDLISKGYTYEKIYPDFDGLAKEANYQMWRDYQNRVEQGSL